MRPYFPAALLVLALSSGSAVNAADYWSGWYAGLNGGYLFSNSNAVNSEAVSYQCQNPGDGGCTANPNYGLLFAIGATGSAPNEFDGFTFGGQVGYNSLFSDWMWGLEADIQVAASTDSSGSYTSVTPSPAFPAQPVTTTFTGTRGLDYLATLRARLGVLLSTKSLAYVTGGLAFGGADLGGAYAQTCTGCTWVDAANTPNAQFDMRDTLGGFTFGGGLEFAIGESWTLKAEYLYYDLGEMVLPMSNGGNASVAPFHSVGTSTLVSADYDGHLVRMGVNFRF